MQGFRERNEQIERDFLSRPITAEKLRIACEGFRESLLELERRWPVMCCLAWPGS